MNTLLTAVAWIIEKVALSGAGFFSWGIGYQPEIPEALLESDK